MRLMLAVSVLLLAAAFSVRADDEQKKADPEFKAPPPKVVPAPAPPTVLVVPYQRTDTREVWQYYAPNRMGRMVPRVIVTPYGPLYSRTLEPYPFAGNNPRAVLPIVVD
jgi:hypothetical protein